MISEKWFEGLSGETRENFRQSIKQSSNVLDKLHKIVYNMLKDHRDVSAKDYDSPSWLAKQAHNNGFCEALSTVIKLIDVDEKNQKGHHA